MDAVTSLLTVSRGTVTERVDRGHCVLADSRGRVVWSDGDSSHVTFLRSSSKPFQATALVQSGALERYRLGTDHLAIACASHHGEPGHVRAAAGILRLAAVSPAMLGCGTHDLGEPEGSALARAGMDPTPLHNNCSGKHSGMLAAAKAMGGPLPTYLDPEHPVQRLILENLADCAGISPQQIEPGVDGCSAPNFAMPLAQMATAFARLGRPQDAGALAPALRRIGEAMHLHPWLISGSNGFDTALMRYPQARFICKAGAEGLQCVALPMLGLGLAVKVESGLGDRIGAVVLAILRALGLLGTTLPPDLARFEAPMLRNHRGLPVGTIHVDLDIGELPTLARSLAR